MSNLVNPPAAVWRRHMAAYGFAVLITGLALAVRWWLMPWVSDRPLLLLFMLPIIFSAYAGGLGAGLASTALSAWGAYTFLLAPRHEGSVDLWQCVMLVVSGALVSGVIEALHRSRRRIAANGRLTAVTLASIGDAVITTDAQGNVTFLNPEAERLTEWKNEAAHGQPLATVFRILNEQTRQPVTDPVAKVLQSGSLAGLANHTVLLGRNGRETLIDDSGAPIQEADGRVAGVVLVFRDCGEKARSQAQLSASVSLLRATIEASDNGLLVVDSGGRVTVYNRRFLELWKIPEEAAALGDEQRLLKLALEQVAEPAEFLRRVEELYARPEQVSFDTIGFKDGRVFERVSHPQRLGDQIIGRVWSFRDVTARKNSEQAVRDRERLLRTVIDVVPHFIFAKDRQSRNLFVNRACAEGNGLTPEEMIGRNDLDFVGDPEQAEAFMRDDREVLKNGKAKFVPEEKFTGPDGRRRVFETHKVPFTMPGSRETALLGVAVDITERVRAEEAVKHERHLLRTLIDLLPDFIFVKDTESRFLVVNKALADSYGRTPAAMLGRTDADFLPAELAARFRASELRVMAADSTFSLEDTITLGDGKTRTVVTNMAAFRDGQGQVCGLVGIGHDLTAQKFVENSMRLQSVALEAAANAILITDRNGNIEWVNPAFTRSTGYALSECLGKNPRQLLRSGRHGREFYQQMWQTILAGQIWHGELFNRRKDGGLYLEEMTITPLLDRENRTTHFVAIKQDITERKRLEEELRAASERTKFYMNRMPLGFIAWDRDFRVAEWNAAAEAIFGWPAGEAIGHHAYDLIVPPDVQPLVNSIWEAIITSGSTPSHSINDNLTRDGRRITCEWRNTPWHDAGGVVCGMLSIVNDITEQKLVEEKFVREQARFKLIFDAVPIGIALHTVHPDGNVTRTINDAHLRLCGLTRDQHDEPGIYTRITHPDDRVVQQQFKAEVEAGRRRHFSMEKRYLHPDGKTVWVNFFYQRETYPDGAIEELTTVTDITERKAAEQQLRQLAVIVESSEDAIIGKTLAGVITSWNRGAETIFGYAASDAIGHAMLLVFPPELKHEEPDILARIARGESIEHFQTERVRKDGKRIRISATISPIKDGQGNIVGAATIARDITQQHILEEQLRQSQKMEAIGQLAGGVAHDFNNILAVIQMQAELSKIDGDYSPEQTACLDEIQSAAGRGANLTRQLLLFSRRQRLQPRELDLGDSITGMTKMLRRILGEDIHVQFKYAAQPLFIHADAGLMDQLVMNLTLNSRDAMPNGGQLVIEAAPVELDALAALQSAQARPGAFVRLSVSDTGCGIPPEILPRIFEPFFTTKDVGKGTGLGLATVFSIVQQHQGWISVESEPGRGTTFHIFLPRLIKNAAQPASAPPAPPAAGGTETILLVEDDDALRASVHKCLTQLGYHLLEAANGVAALSVWQEHRDRIHLLLTDLVMPGGLSGKELGERLRRENPELKVIYTSGYNSEIFGKDVPPVGGVTFLSKPFAAQTLAQMVRDCLDKK